MKWNTTAARVACLHPSLTTLPSSQVSLPSAQCNRKSHESLLASYCIIKHPLSHFRGPSVFPGLPWSGRSLAPCPCPCVHTKVGFAPLFSLYTAPLVSVCLFCLLTLLLMVTIARQAAVASTVFSVAGKWRLRENGAGWPKQGGTIDGVGVWRLWDYCIP